MYTGLHVRKVPVIIVRFEWSWRLLDRSFKIICMKIRPLWTRFVPCGQTNRHTDMAKVSAALFCNFAPRNVVCVTLTLIILMWRMWWAPNNANKWQMGFNSAFEGLNFISAFRFYQKFSQSEKESKQPAIITRTLQLLSQHTPCRMANSSGRSFLYPLDLVDPDRFRRNSVTISSNYTASYARRT